MTTYRLPMRWADIDQLNHVNNIVYLAYAEEARAALVDDGVIDGGLRPTRIAVDFALPMQLSKRPVLVGQEVDGSLLRQEIAQEVDGSRVVFARVETELGVPGRLGDPQLDGVAVPFRGRRGDLGPSGRVEAAQVFEYFQEARIIAMSQGWTDGRLGQLVLARLEVVFGEPVCWRPEPWQFVMGVERVGTKSFTLAAEWRDGDRVLARSRAVLVGFDVATQSGRALSESERAYVAEWGKDG
ncbi:acyl-CoA thioesterase [Aeromicrobium sp.]|uniref:acyl-CoA thioesterase n=1 Tax=Aeromicrobium sp. TaxID=1871063 RepID=UPI0039E48CB9